MIGRRCALLVCALVPATQAAPAAAQPASSFTNAVVKEVNAVRKQAGLKPLKRSRPLAHAARNHSADVANAGVIAHTSSDGTPMQTRLHRWIRARSIGETIAFLPFKLATPREALNVWMNSAPHRAALLNPRFRRIGVGRGAGDLGGGGYIVTVDLASAR